MLQDPSTSLEVFELQVFAKNQVQEIQPRETNQKNKKMKKHFALFFSFMFRVFGVLLCPLLFSPLVVSLNFFTHHFRCEPVLDKRSKANNNKKNLSRKSSQPMFEFPA